MVSCDVKSLLTSIPLEHIIDITIKRNYEKHEITSAFSKNDNMFILNVQKIYITVSIIKFIFRLYGLWWIHNWDQ